ncbi:hypothetical protein L3X38_010673 [Prunus dulcis]|uniref:Uncharacterized protein n=1 Tax=Prunus dulcis TaxID=3755 RepID=A0AAD4WIP8_PRUDU|nr:hypothetical protein L3X38_010673 [Prunus dulcis]
MCQVIFHLQGAGPIPVISCGVHLLGHQVADASGSAMAVDDDITMNESTSCVGKSPRRSDITAVDDHDHQEQSLCSSSEPADLPKRRHILYILKPNATNHGTPKLSELEAGAIPGWVTTLGSCSVSSQKQNRAGWNSEVKRVGGWSNPRMGDHPGKLFRDFIIKMSMLTASSTIVSSPLLPTGAHFPTHLGSIKKGIESHRLAQLHPENYLRR